MFGVILFAFAISACTSTPPSVAPPTRALVQGAAQSTSGPTGSALVLTPTETGAATPAPLRFDGNHAYGVYVLDQMKFGIRPAGSTALRSTGDYIIAELNRNGWQVETQEFNFRGVPIRNVIAKSGAGQEPPVIVGAHYDTRPRANMDPVNPAAPVPGANDGASGVAVLLELARTLDKSKLKNEVWLAFFDAEDNGELSACDLRIVPMQADSPGCDTTPWTWSVGASHVADTLTVKPLGVIVLDMIGDADQGIYYERNSDAAFQEQIWRTAAQLGYRQWFIPEFRWSMTDDHTPFLQKGIRAVDMIDFDYPPWHTTSDTADKLSAASLERVGRTMQTWLENMP